MRKPLLLLTSSAFVLASVMPALPPASAEEGIAAGAYWTFSFGGNEEYAAQPQFGLHVGRQVEGQPPIAPDSDLGGTGYVPMRSMMDLRFTEAGPVALNFGGLNTLPYIGPALGFHGGLGNATLSQQQEDQEHLLMGLGGGIGAALIICALAGCFGGDEEGGDDDDDDTDGGTA